METLISSPYSLFDLRHSTVSCPAICYGQSFRDSTNHALDEPIHAKQYLVGWFFTGGDAQLPGLIFDGAPEDVEAPAIRSCLRCSTRFLSVSATIGPKGDRPTIPVPMGHHSSVLFQVPARTCLIAAT